MVFERLEERFVLQDDVLGRVDGGNVVYAANQDQTQGAAHGLAVLVHEAGVAVVNLTSLTGQKLGD